jgi:hypothetical protein
MTLSGEPHSEKPSAPKCPSNLVLDRFNAGDLPMEEAILVQEHLRACSTCDQRVRELLATRERIEAVLPALGQRHPAKNERRGVGGLAAGGAFALAVAAGALFLLPTGKNFDPEITRTKGSGALGFYVKRGEDVRAGGSGEVLHPGDAVQFTYRGQSSGYLAIFGVSGEDVSVYYPTGERAAVWSAERPDVPQSTVLDEVLGPEVFVSVLCPDPVQVREVQRALAASAAVRDRFAVATCQVDTVTVEKRQP